MSDLSEFLLTRIAEDEERARVETVLRDGDPYYDDPGEANSYERRFTPGRVIAECEAKRRIVGDMSFVGEHACALLLRVGKMLALPYADHADYRDEWRP